MKYKSTKKGFTIVETLVAVAILVIGVTAPITVITSAINASRLAEDRTLAYYFAQEGIEYVRYVRDTNIINSEPDWLEYMANCIGIGSICDVRDPTSAVSNNALRTCNNADGLGCFLRLNGGVFKGFNGGPSKHRRAITVNEDVPATEAVVTVTVSWTNKGTPYSYTLTERMFNWSGI